MRNQRLTPLNASTGSKPGGSGLGSGTTRRRGERSPGRLDRGVPPVWVATRKVCGVLVDGRRGIAGHRPCRPISGERGNRSDASRPVSGRTGTSSAGSAGSGRSRRISSSRGKPGTWRRAAAGSQWQDWNARRSPVNTGAPSPSAVRQGRGYWGSRRSCTVGLLMTVVVGLMICSTRDRSRVPSGGVGTGAEKPRSAHSWGGRPTADYIRQVRGEEQFLADLRADLRAGRLPRCPCGNG